MVVGWCCETKVGSLKMIDAVSGCLLLLCVRLHLMGVDGAGTVRANCNAFSGWLMAFCMKRFHVDCVFFGFVFL